MTHRRIVLKNSRGWKLPENTISVTGTSKWKNWFPCGGNKQSAYNCYTDWLENKMSYCPIPPTKQHIKNELRGKNLACWCSLDEPCHADILLKIANEK